jgi:type II secretory pathway component PulF
LQRLTRSLHQGLVDGRSFSQALRDFPRIFSPLYVNLVLAGEASGALTDILTRLVKHLTNMKVLRDRVSQALVYPAFLAIAGAGLIIIFITVMVPQLQTFFSNTNGGSLPLPTQMLIEANYLVVHYWWLAATIAGLGYAMFKVATRSVEGRMNWDRLRLSLPGIGSVVKHQFYAQFARTMGTLLQNGVTLLKSMELLEDMSGNTYLKARMYDARTALVDGSSLSVALGKQQIFPELFLDMMAVGETSGRFAETMQMTADVYERELDARVKIATAIIPPIIIVAIAVVVGAVVFGIISAVFSVTSALPTRVH